MVYDACVLYPAPLRDTLMRLALTDLFKAHWSSQIHEEWIQALLQPYGIDVMHPDDFICYQIDINAPTCCKALREQRMGLRNPPFTVEQFLATLQKQQLPQTVSKLREYADFL